MNERITPKINRVIDDWLTEELAEFERHLAESGFANPLDASPPSRISSLTSAGSTAEGRGLGGIRAIASSRSTSMRPSPAEASEMDVVDHETLLGWLTRLQLTAIRDQLDSLLDEAAEKKLTLREALAFLVEREVSRKDERRIEMAFKIAHFPAVRELADFDFKAQPSIWSVAAFQFSNIRRFFGGQFSMSPGGQFQMSLDTRRPDPSTKRGTRPSHGRHRDARGWSTRGRPRGCRRWSRTTRRTCTRGYQPAARRQQLRKADGYAGRRARHDRAHPRGGTDGRRCFQARSAQ